MRSRGLGVRGHELVLYCHETEVFCSYFGFRAVLILDRCSAAVGGGRKKESEACNSI